MAAESLITLLDVVRSKTLRILADVKDDQARFSAGLNNHILWHAGHIVVVNERLGVSASTGADPILPAGWVEKFGSKSEPAKVTSWPSLDEVIAKLKDQQERFKVALQNVPDSRWGAIVNEARGWTLLTSVCYGLNDEAAHTGEIYLLKKLWKKEHG